MCFYVISRVLLAFIVLINVITALKLSKYRNEPYYGPDGHLEASEEEHQDLTKIPGEPGVDYPIYHSVPETSFSCSSVPAVPGMYANVETGCQAYHVCHDGREGHQGASFLCSNGTLFNQKEFTCDWWYKVDCRAAPELYRLNADPETNPFTPKVKSEEAKSEEIHDYYRPSVSSKYNYKPQSRLQQLPYDSGHRYYQIPSAPFQK